MKSPIKIIIHGAKGKMGRQIIQCALQDPEVKLAGAVEANTDSSLGQDVGELMGIGTLGIKLVSEISSIATGEEVVIDFSNPEASMKILSLAHQKNLPIVVGTTGFTVSQDEEFKKLSGKIRCVRAPNMSVGVNLLFKLVYEAARVLGNAYDVEIIEAHHHFKKDAPSGTAKAIVQSVSKALGLNPEKDVVYGRDGLVGERKKNEIGVFAVRGGDIVGDHTVLFAGMGERLELIHRAHSRETLARGALRAAKFVASAKPGLYNMQEVLGIQ